MEASAKTNQQRVKDAKERLLTFLSRNGINEAGNLIVACIRKSRGGLVGYYSNLSQFRGGRARIVVDVDSIKNGMAGCSKILVDEEILKTVAHEYGHVIAEAIREVPRLSGGDRFNVPDWKPVFGNDEERFAEDFASLVVEYTSAHEIFWGEFLPAYAAELKRLFVSDEDEPESTPAMA